MGLLSVGNIAFSSQESKACCIFVTLGGGASHVEFFNPSPDAPSEYRSVTGSIQTKTSGLNFGGLLPNLANISDKFTIVKSFGHKDFNHASATHLVQTGNYNTRTPDTQTWPSYGSVISKKYGPVIKGVPQYIKLNKEVHSGAAWLGLDYDGFDASKEGLADMIMSVSEERFKRREMTLNTIDRSSNISDEWVRLRDQAIGVLHGDVSKIFNIEKDSGYSKYKDSQFGKDLLTAKRLAQGGASFIKVSHGGWDHHQNIENSLKRMQPEIDKYLAQLIIDLQEIDTDVLLVFTTEFGRTPKINQQSGRDHWGKVCNLLLCGNKYHGGYIGELDKTASEVTNDPVYPKDLCRTILEHCGIGGETVIDNLQRPRIFIDETAKVIKEMS